MRKSTITTSSTTRTTASHNRPMYPLEHYAPTHRQLGMAGEIIGAMGQRLREVMFRGLTNAAATLTPARRMVGRPVSPAEVLANRERAPIVLVPGFGAPAKSWDVWQRSLQRDGFTVERFMPSSAFLDAYQGGAELKAFVQEVARRHGGRLPDVVAHSKGGLDARVAVQMLNMRPLINRLITVNTPHAGLRWGRLGERAGVLVPPAGRTLLKGTALITKLGEGGEAKVMGKALATVRTSYWDGVVWPPSSARLAGAVNVAMKDGHIGPLSRINHMASVLNQDEPLERVRTLLSQAGNTFEPPGPAVGSYAAG